MSKMELVKWDQLVFDVSGVDDRVKSRVRRNRYEGQTIDRLKKLCPVDIPFVNLGACMGIVDCIHNVKMTNPEQHVAVEGNPDACKINEANRARNGAKHTILNRAYSSSQKDISFFVPDHSTELIMAGSVDDRFKEMGMSGRQVSVQGVTLKEIIEENGFEQIALCVDIEGAELDLVQNELMIIAHYCDWMVIEWHFTNDQDDPDRIASLKCKRMLKKVMKFHVEDSNSRMSVFSRLPAEKSADQSSGMMKSIRKAVPHKYRAMIPAALRDAVRRIVTGEA